MTEAGVEVLLIRRVPEEGGFWQGVSGCVESTDFSLASAAARETEEETGLAVEAADLFDLELTTRFRGPMSGRWFEKIALGFALAPTFRVDDVRLCAEHDAVCLVPLDRVRALLAFPTQWDEVERLAKFLLDRSS